MRNPDVVERTLAEVAGTLLTARLALQHGLAVRCPSISTRVKHSEMHAGWAGGRKGSMRKRGIEY